MELIIMDSTSKELKEIPNHKPEYELEFIDEFAEGFLNKRKWFDYYLPHWSSKELSRAIYHFRDNQLVLKIIENQKPWCPEFDDGVRVSSVQTGHFAGTLGSSIGQHKFNSKCVVREQIENFRLYTPQYGYFETKVKASISTTNMVALWMIGYEDKPEFSAEICIFEIFGKDVGTDSVLVGYGLHPFNDPKIKDEFYRESFNIDIRKFHIYAIEWTPNYVDFFIDNKKVRTVNQSPNYPMQFMLNIYEFPEEQEKQLNEIIYPKEFAIDYFRGYKLKKGY